jgi:succinate dehydrogenase flavin-adding protein (antitoxin of CptAB toxin-antitoxin module)
MAAAAEVTRLSSSCRERGFSLVDSETDYIITSFFTMTLAKAFPPALREIRILCSQTGAPSAGTRLVKHIQLAI